MNLVHYVQCFFAGILGFTAIVELSHFRYYLKRNRWERVIFTLIAASASGYMASEALDGEWPSWGES